MVHMNGSSMSSTFWGFWGRSESWNPRLTQKYIVLHSYVSISVALDEIGEWLTAHINGSSMLYAFWGFWSHSESQNPRLTPEYVVLHSYTLISAAWTKLEGSWQCPWPVCSSLLSFKAVGPAEKHRLLDLSHNMLCFILYINSTNWSEGSWWCISLVDTH